MINKPTLTKYINKFTEVIYSNYNFTNSSVGWNTGGSVSQTNEGINGSMCAKLSSDFAGVYRNFTITPNILYRFDVIAKATTTTNLSIVLKNPNTDATLVTKLVPQSTNYVLYSIEYTTTLTSLRLGFEVYPGSGTLYINEARIFKF